MTGTGFWDLESFAETRVKLLASRAETHQMSVSSKSAKASMIGLGVLTLLAAWIGFQLGTHRHTRILRTLTQAKHFLSEASAVLNARQRSASAPAGPQHSVSLSWKASPSAVVGYNVYRRGTAGVIKLNSEPVTGTSYVDRAVQPGQTYFYVTKAVNARNREYPFERGSSRHPFAVDSVRGVQGSCKMQISCPATKYLASERGKWLRSNYQPLQFALSIHRLPGRRCIGE